MPRLRNLGLLALLVVSPLLSSCRIGRAAANATTALFTTPDHVTKNTRPVANDARLAVVWIGHATALVQIEDKVILTDPIFRDTAGQVAKRLVEPGVDPKDLPPIDAVVISHMHYDHLSLGSLDDIESKVRALMMPRGGTAYLTDFNFPAYELRTWQAWEKNGLRITAVPVDHVGYRYGLDREWMPDSFTGYVIEYKGIKVYFGGDTAYNQQYFVETGSRFPNIDLALLPIGPIEPHDLMREYHTDPAEAVQAFVDLGAARMVPVHYDTFINSTDKPGDALKLLDAASHRWSLGQRIIAPLKIGERRVFVKAGADARLPPESKPAVTPSPAPATKTPAKKADDDDFD